MTRLAFLTISEKNAAPGKLTASSPVYFARRTLWISVTAHFAALPLFAFAAATLEGASSSMAFVVVMAVPAIVALWWEVQYVERSPKLVELARSILEEATHERAKRERAAEWYRWGSLGLLMIAIASVMAACIAVAPMHVSR